MTQLQTTLRQLRLSGLMQTQDLRLQETAAARLGHGEFLELIFQDELNVRHQRMLARRTNATACSLRIALMAKPPVIRDCGPAGLWRRRFPPPSRGAD